MPGILLAMGDCRRRVVLIGVLSMVVPVIGCGGSSKRVDGGPTGGTGGNSGTDAATTVQYFELSWTITSSIDGATLTCTETGASGVSVTVDTTVFDLPCAPGQGNTGVVPPGPHSVSAELFTSNRQSLSRTSTRSATLQANVPQVLPEIEFLVNL